MELDLKRRRKRIPWFNPRRPEQYLDPRYQQWRNAVLRRDRYKCRWPNCKCRQKLQVHHIARWADYPMLRYEVTNGVTLCKEHHKLVNQNEEIYAQMLIIIIGNKNV